jgi:hypothetical protein
MAVVGNSSRRALLGAGLGGPSVDYVAATDIVYWLKHEDPDFPRRTAMTGGGGTTPYLYVPVGTNGALQLCQETGPLSGRTITYGDDPLGQPSSRAVARTGTESFGTERCNPPAKALDMRARAEETVRR